MAWDTANPNHRQRVRATNTNWPALGGNHIKWEVHCNNGISLKPPGSTNNWVKVGNEYLHLHDGAASDLEKWNVEYKRGGKVEFKTNL